MADKTFPKRRRIPGYERIPLALLAMVMLLIVLGSIGALLF